MTAERNGTSAENAQRGANEVCPSGWALLAGLLFAPAAWFLQTNLAQTLAAQICYPHDRPVASPALPWLMPSIVVLAVAAFAVGLAGFVIAWRNWRRTSGLVALLAARRPVAVHAARDCFLARVGTIMSGIFLFGLIAADVAMLIVSPCTAG